MRIAMLVRRFDPAGGGTERDFAAAARCLADAGHEVRIYAARARASLWHEMPVHPLPLPRLPRSLEVIGFGLLAGRFARRDGTDLTISFGRTIDSDLIRCEGGAHAAYLEAARQWESAAASAARAMSPYHAAQCRIEARGFASRRLRMVLAISRMVAGDVQRRFAIAPDKVETLYNGLDQERLESASDPHLRMEVRRRLGIDQASPVALFIGNGFARKGLRKLLEAWPMAAARNYLLVAGEDRALQRYWKMARRLRIDDRVLFLGKRNDIAGLLAAADIVTLPSLFEAFGNVVLEGMAAGLPVLTSARCGAAEVLPAELRQFVVQDPMNPAEIAQRLDALLAAPREIGALARAAAAQFTWERYGKRLLELIEESAVSNLAST
jgi:UDP-glucose:(heptosyl)LPS alpha-1,3-glucosyltransferase